jgi:hypothetical protein
MIVKCVRTKVSEFPIQSSEHMDYFDGLFGSGSTEKNFDDLIIGQEYVVYRIKITRGYPSYFLRTSERPFYDFFTYPGLCFEIVDNQMSKYWHYDTKIYNDARLGEIFFSTIAIREWIEQPSFFERIVDGRSPELEIWMEAARKIRIEALGEDRASDNIL